MKRTPLMDGFLAADLTPLVDIVFLVSTFLMLAMYFENTQADERIKLPKDVMARPPEPHPAHELVLQVRFDPDATGLSRGSQPLIDYAGNRVAIDQIRLELEQEQRVFQKVHRQDHLDDVSVVIRAEAEVPTGFVQRLVQVCQDVGYAKFSLRPLPMADDRGREPRR